MLLRDVLLEIRKAAEEKRLGIVVPALGMAVMMGLRKRGFSVTKLESGNCYVRWSYETLDFSVCENNRFKAPDAYLIARKREDKYEHCN